MANHVPVMLEEVVAALAPADGDVMLDATFGAGGYARAILEANARACLLAIDRDPEAFARADALKGAYGDRFAFRQARFSQMEEAAEAAGAGKLNGVVFDIGVSSMQLDDAARGFSFRADGPLDMRMGADGPSAGDVVAHAGEAELAEIFKVYGEERQARRIASALVSARADAPIATTARLAGLVESVVGRGDGRIHPATRVFQALRIFVNDELGELSRGLRAAERLLAPGGRLVVVSFHSLEDRIVKNFLHARAGRRSTGSRHAPPTAQGPAPSFRLAFVGARSPADEEIAANPRARSAKLRAAERTPAPAWEDDAHAARAPRFDLWEAAS